MEVFGLYSYPDGEYLMFVLAKDKKDALNLINSTGGYQGRNLELDCDYVLKKVKDYSRYIDQSSIIIRENQRIYLMNILDDFIDNFFKTENEEEI